MLSPLGRPPPPPILSSGNKWIVFPGGHDIVHMHTQTTEKHGDTAHRDRVHIYRPHCMRPIHTKDAQHTENKHTSNTHRETHGPHTTHTTDALCTETTHTIQIIADKKKAAHQEIHTITQQTDIPSLRHTSSIACKHTYNQAHRRFPQCDSYIAHCVALGWSLTYTFPRLSEMES